MKIGVDFSRDGYRVTICRPRCGPLMSHGRPLGSREGGRRKVEGGKSSEEWTAAAWSSWKTTSLVFNESENFPRPRNF
jgi:hypothetical protein